MLLLFLQHLFNINVIFPGICAEKIMFGRIFFLISIMRELAEFSKFQQADTY